MHKLHATLSHCGKVSESEQSIVSHGISDNSDHITIGLDCCEDSKARYYNPSIQTDIVVLRLSPPAI